MSSATIDLTSIASDWSQPMLNLEFTFDENRRSRAYVHKQYQKQKELAAGHLNRWFREFNATLINQVDDFIKQSMDMDEESLFPNLHSNVISAASLVLGLHASDHQATLDLIEEHVHDNYQYIQTYRVGSDYIKRAHFIDLIQDIRGNTNVLVIIEHLETIDRFLLKIFITILHDLLDETDLNRAMILFGLSTNWEELGSILPIGALNRIKIRGTIVIDTHDDVSDTIKEKLLTVDEYDTRIGPKVLNFINYTVLERDLSIANLSYLFQYCLLEHSLQSRAIFKLPKEQLTQLLKSEPDIMTQLKDYKFIRQTSVNLESSPAKVADFFVGFIHEMKEYFKFMWSQINSYFILLQDETDNVFPAHIFDLYEAVMENQNFGDSRELMDAITKFSKYPSDVLMKRLELCCSDIVSLNGSLNEKDIRLKLIKLKDRILNNDEDAKIRSQLRTELQNHALSLTSPIKFPMSELIYFDNLKSVMPRTLPSTRLEASKSFIDNRSCFGLLYGLIHNGPEEINLADLYEDFVIALDQSNILKPEKSERKSTGVRLKTTAKRRTRLYSVDAQVSVAPSSSPTCEETGLKKAIFIDLIECMVYQGLIIKDTRQSKRGIVRRSVWL